MSLKATRVSVGLLVVVLVGLVGCTTTAPSVSLSVTPTTLTVGDSATVSITGSPGSSMGLWTYTLRAEPTASCSGSFSWNSPASGAPGNPTTSAPALLTSVTATYDSTGATPGNCTIRVRLTTSSGRFAEATVIITIQAAAPSQGVGFYYIKGASGTSDSIMRLMATLADANNVNPNSTCAVVPTGQIECDDDSGDTYTDYSGFVSSGLNSIIVDNLVTATNALAIHGYNGGAMSCTPNVPGTTGCALYRHNPGTQILETSDPQALPPIPACSVSQTTVGPLAAGGRFTDLVGPMSPSAFYVQGSLDSADTFDEYTFTANAGDIIFIAMGDGPSDYDLRLSGPAGTILVDDVDVEAIATPIPAGQGGTYTIRVIRFSGSGPYTLTVCRAN